MKVNYLGIECGTHFACYRKGQIALQLVTVEGFPVARASVNVEEVKLGPDEIIVYEREYPGMTQALLDAGVVAEPRAQHRLGFVCKLAEAALLEFKSPMEAESITGTDDHGRLDDDPGLAIAGP